MTETEGVATQLSEQDIAADLESNKIMSPMFSHRYCYRIGYAAGLKQAQKLWRETNERTDCSQNNTDKAKG